MSDGLEGYNAMVLAGYWESLKDPKKMAEHEHMMDDLEVAMNLIMDTYNTITAGLPVESRLDEAYWYVNDAYEMLKQPGERKEDA